ncbi:hypothetical protein HOP50_20g86220 [Chloropicon primus]|uniref:Translocon-associated protein subunit alpha n=1 Tax=Chloropicon primus TaxID=1764295 RepID=A0A5B8N0K5_9CHLO|nr:hypothetical protein A3770_20p85890 [Chloropicon primus]UPR05272.1 hypothetical protein HOP50_20g86220 [Chloropicon primus]|eukprot:QDZ26071.1 hypothetical protein A3770_20p85890 [Chloropicon primus]
MKRVQEKVVLVAVVAAVCLAGCVTADAQEKVKGAFVHVHKDFDVFEGTVGKDMEFTVEIHNMGDGDAYNVDFFDDAIEKEDGKSFKLKEGSFKNHFDKIEAGDYVTFKQVIVPLAAGPLLLPSSVVTYTEDKSGGKKTSVIGSVDGFNVMTSTQANTKNLLAFGKYASFGFCKTLGDWVRFAAFAVVIGTIVVGKSAFSKTKKLNEARKRKAARKALGVDDIKDD